MDLKTVIPFPIFAPTSTSTTTTTTTTSTTQLRFSRWGNANAEKFEHRPQQIIEDDLRRLRRFNSAFTISNSLSSSTTPPSNPTFKSTGTPSSPSRPSIPGKKSKYSKPLAFRPHNKTRFPPPNWAYTPPGRPQDSVVDAAEGSRWGNIRETQFKIADGGELSYVVPGAPFEFRYSYTETPRVRPVGLREPAVSPFGPGTIPRPWTGRKPWPESKKELAQFDSFVPPPGSEPRYTMAREEVLGEALTEEEVKELVEECRKTYRQLNIGRDGLTHNMLENIHAHWMRRRACKIKCRGVCTVDMDNLCEQLEERTGGKIIYCRGGIIYLFRGRNYNYKTRPRFPLMLWKPVSPVYPRLVKRIPEGLTLQEATDMRRRGHELPPICKLGKNGVYINLVNTIREAFEVCDLVRIDCQGLNPSDYHKIGAKLKDLVPCVLISFKHEHVLMWRGKDWKSSLLSPEDGRTDYRISESDSAAFLGSYTEASFSSDDEQESTCSEDEQGSAFSEDKQESVFLSDKEGPASISSNISYRGASSKTPNLNKVLTNDLVVNVTGFVKTSSGKEDVTFEVNGMIQNQTNTLERETLPDSDYPSADDVNSAAYSCESETRTVIDFNEEEAVSVSVKPDFNVDADGIGDLKDTLTNSSGNSATHGELQGMTEISASAVASCTEGVLNLLKQAVESGSAIVLDDSSIDADVVYERSVAFAQVATPGPVFIHPPGRWYSRNVKIKSVVVEVDGSVSNNIEVQEAVPDPLP